jgi:hypothetical protein
MTEAFGAPSGASGKLPRGNLLANVGDGPFATGSSRHQVQPCPLCPESDQQSPQDRMSRRAISGHSRLPFPKNMQPLRTGNEPDLNPFSRSSLARRKQQLPLLGADALRERGCPKLADQRGLRKASRQCTRQRLERPEQEILGHEFPAR